MRTPMTADDYRASRPIVDPLRLFDCSPVGDGAVCVIVAAAGANARAVRITGAQGMRAGRNERSEEHTSELQSLMRISYAVFCLKKKNKQQRHRTQSTQQ